MIKSWHKVALIVLYLYVLVTIFRLTDATSHSGSDTLIALALPFIALTLILGFAISTNKR